MYKMVESELVIIQEEEFGHITGSQFSAQQSVQCSAQIQKYIECQELLEKEQKTKQQSSVHLNCEFCV